MNQAQAAQTRYQKACREMVAIMKKTKVAKEDWEKCRTELNAAIDERTAVLRVNGRSAYGDTGDPFQMQFTAGQLLRHVDL
ncbi:hypothetical protein [Pseudomonas abietaniphila]|uniref:hypothetical protein n=1 Tax=Pseudomonas abietaniphila TaxID=89065 RepID=UPI000784C6FE|nr:hypothetical protein [Pseudomonas abietaniphila]